MFPPRDDSYFLGVLKNDFIFRHAQAAHDRFSENWILGGAACRNQPMFDSLFSRSDEEIVAKICAERTKRFGIESHCDGAVITRWPQALPHYTVELEAILNDLPEHEQNVFLVGNYLGQIGLSKILERTKVIPSRIESLGQWSNLQ